MEHNDFDKLNTLYGEIITIVCTAKETNDMDEKLDYLLKLFYKVDECLEFSPYTHFYTQVLIDIIVKTYNTQTLRTDLLVKSKMNLKLKGYSTTNDFTYFQENS